VFWSACGADSGAPEHSTSASSAGHKSVKTKDAGVAAAYLGLEQPSDGFQLRSIGTDIAAGADTEYCEVAQLPGSPSDTYYAKSFELGNGAHSHHLIVTAATLGGAAEAKLMTLGVGNRIECLGAELKFGDAGFEGVGGSQQPYTQIMLPEGVGREYHGGQLIVFDYHYLNTGAAPVPARSAINFHLTDRSEIQHLARGFSFRNFTIDIPAGGSASFMGECHFTADVRVGGLTRHTHRWGTDYSVWYSGGTRDGEQIWTSNDWEHEVDYMFPDPVLVNAGEGFRFRCSYSNDGDSKLRFGTSASDEMCILFGTLWEARDGEQLGPQSCSISWVDGAGIGHSAYEAGGVPKPSAQQTAACVSAGGASISACQQCRCDSCAAPAINCATDSECSPVLKCYTGCAGDADCLNGCQTLLDQHSSAAGLLVQMTQCFDSKCKSTCQPAPAP
jgi:hypothetical protein